MDNAHQRWIVHTGPGMSAKWVGNGPVTNTSGGTGAEKGAARWTEPRRRVFMRSAESDWIFRHKLVESA